MKAGIRLLALISLVAISFFTGCDFKASNEENATTSSTKSESPVLIEQGTGLATIPGKSEYADSPIVQIWQNDPAIDKLDFSGTGLVVGNGSQVLTVFNYGEYTPDDSLEVVWPDHGEYAASVKAINPRTSVTLLEITGAKIPVATIGDASIIQNNQILVEGWHDFGNGPVFQSDKQNFPGFGAILFVKPNTFAAGGDIVTDEKGDVIGIIGTLYNEFVFRLGGPGMTAPIIDIKDALKLLSPDANQPGAKGPVETVITSQNIQTEISISGYPLPDAPLLDYNKMTNDIADLLGTMGEPLPVSEIPADYRDFSWGDPTTRDGILLSVLYPRPVELHNIAGDLVATAKWVGIQWDLSEGKPNQVFYGSVQGGNCITEGGFILDRDTSALAADIGQSNSISGTFLDSLLLPAQQITLEEASNVLGNTVSLPGYLPDNYKIQDVYNQNGAVRLLISNTKIDKILTTQTGTSGTYQMYEFQIPMDIQIVWGDQGIAGGLKLPGERPTINPSQGATIASVIVNEDDRNNLWWDWRPDLNKPGMFEIVISANKQISNEDLIKIAESLRIDD